MAKDLRTAADIARHLGVAAPLADACDRLWTDADAAPGADADHTEIFRYLTYLYSGRAARCRSFAISPSPSALHAIVAPGPFPTGFTHLRPNPPQHHTTLTVTPTLN